MFIEATTHKAATDTWYIIIIVVFILRRKQCNEDKHYDYVQKLSILIKLLLLTTYIMTKILLYTKNIKFTIP